MFANLGSGQKRLALAAGYGLFAALGVALFWGFTVDDALVTARVAWRISNGFGYRFNASGPAVDAVTPLGWVYVLVPFSRDGPLGGLAAARVLGVLGWTMGAVWLGYSTTRAAAKPPVSIMPLLAAAPLGAWASAGMETGVVVGLCAVALGDSLAAALARSVLAGWRPELVPFCVVLGFAPVSRSLGNRRAAALRMLAPIASFACVSCIRKYSFGSAIPLSAIAKPSDAAHGLSYVVSALVFLGPTWALVGPGWRRLDYSTKCIAVAVAVHWATLVTVGGDWMALWRLALPSVPALLWIVSDLSAVRSRAWNTIAMAASLAVAAVVAWQVGWPARHVMHARLALIRQASPLLRGAHLTAGLDIGWLGVATPNDVQDLAGITDPRVAALPGGHTTKKIPNSWFDFRKPDALVLLTAPGEPVAPIWWETRFARGVENLVARHEYWRDCSLEGTLPLLHTRQSYVFVRCQPH